MARASGGGRKRHSAKQLIGRLWLRVFGWSLDERLPDVERAVLVAAPHTSNWDLPFSIAVAWALGVRMQWVGKHTLFRPPFGWFMRRLGGIGVDRSQSSDTVEALVKIFAGRPELMLLIAPSGTRRKAPRWKTGFYYVAVGARVPIVLAYLDYRRKRGGLGEVFVPSGDIGRDFEAIRSFYAPIRGKFPEQETEISLGAPVGASGPAQERP
ncbi:MAG: lysophospholipid acyltransferase family protein [Myxococcales bacterium]